MKKLSFLLIGAMVALFACQTDYEEKARNPEFMHRSLTQLNEIIIYDIFPPPIASRIYAYSSIAGYEAGHYDRAGYRSLAGQLNGLTELPKPDTSKEYCFTLAGVHAFLAVGKALTFSETEMEAFRQGLYAEFRKTGMPRDVYDRSLKFGDAVALAVLAWSKKDNYKETRTFPKFTVDESNPARWSPTPPDYKDAVEPHWGKIRPFTLDSAGQFLPPPPTPFSTDPKSQFIKEANDVKIALEGDPAQKKAREEIAYFWDDNPFVSHHVGHVMFATKKVTPGGHWMNITQLALRKTKSDYAKSAQAYLYTALCLADGFISCWHAKYTYNLVRPETVINKYIDEEWRPFLQTPNFPEHTSGHSVISRSSATALTALFGDNFAFRDITNEPYGRPARNFKSFVDASEEASISRFYGGIHYMNALTMGAAQGEKVGKHVLERVKTKD